MFKGRCPIRRGTVTPPETLSDSRFLLRISREHAVWMIQLADMKANVLMAASAILAGLLVQQSVPVCNDSARYVVLLAVGLALSSAGAAVLTLIPRTKSEQHNTLLYYRAALEYEDWDEYYAKVKDLSAADVDRELAGQTWELARILERKYNWLRWGFVLFGSCLVVTFVGLAWAHVPCP
jgi:hypothetical protein